MKNNKILLLAIVSVAVGCTKKSPEILISKWEKKILDENTVERRLASGPQGQCLKDIFTVDTLKREVQDLERSFSQGEKVRGSWKHLNLSSLPVPQANFLKTYGDKIGDQGSSNSIDYSVCEDVPCLFNQIYGKGDYVAGYVHYLWYLRFGNMLSADNKLPSQNSKVAGEYNGKKFLLSDYLYNEKELYGLWRLSLMLKTPHTTLNYLKEVQRIPRGEKFEGEYAGACGLASGAGWILLNDGCLTIYSDDDQGYLYHAVTHELTHHVDFEQGRGSRKYYRSHKEDYLELAGMFITEYVDEKGKTQRKWELKPGSKLMTSYAGTSPQENFAESIAVFRVEGDRAKKQITNTHYSFVSKDYYQNRAFHKEALIDLWIEKYSADTGKEVFKAVIDCSKEKSSPKSTYFRPSDFSSPVLPGMINCIGKEASDISSNLRAKTILYEPEGCLNGNDSSTRSIWDSQMKVHLKKSFDKYLQELTKDQEYLARIQQYYSKISDKTIARNAYISCYGEENEESCYNEKLRNDAYDNALNLNLPEVQTREMADMYISYHLFSVIQDETKKHYQTFVTSNQESIRNESMLAWEGCQALSHNDDEQPTGSIFQIGDNYMISSFYNCLNANLPETIKEIVRNFSVDGLQLQHPKEELILHEHVKPQVVRILKDEYFSEKQKEEKASQNIIAQDNGQIRKKLLSDFNWVTNIVDNNQLLQDCKKEGYKLMPILPLYNQRSALFSSFLERYSCRNISSTSEYNNWLNNSKADFNDKVINGIEDQITELGNLRAAECLKRYPVDSALNKLRYRKQREACLLDEWPKLESQVLEDASKNPIVIRLQISTEVLKGKLETNRRRLQIRIIKEHFN